MNILNLSIFRGTPNQNLSLANAHELEQKYIKTELNQGLTTDVEENLLSIDIE